MRNLILLPILLFVFISCKKDLNSLSSNETLQLEKTTAYLKSKMSPPDFNTLDFTKADVTSLDSGNILLWRVPFSGKSIATDFVLVQAGANGDCVSGRIIHLENAPGNIWNYSGSVNIQSLTRL